MIPTIHPLANIPLEIVIIDQHAADKTNNKVKLTGLWPDIKDNLAIAYSPVIVAMIDALLALNEDLYLYVDMVIGAHQIYISQIV